MVPVEILQDILEDAWLRAASPLARQHLYKTFAQVSPVFHEAATRLPRVLAVTSGEDKALCAEMDNDGASFLNKSREKTGLSETETFFPSSIAQRHRNVYLHLNETEEWQRRFTLVAQDLTDISSIITDCISITICARNVARVALETWAKIYETLHAFPSLQEVHLDYIPTTYSPTPGGSLRISQVPLPGPHPLVTFLRIAHWVLPSGGPSGLPTAKGLAELYPMLRHLHIYGFAYIPALHPPPTVELLVVEMPAEFMKRRNLNFAKLGIGAAVRAGTMVRAPGDGSAGRKTIVFRTDTDDDKLLVWWDETRKVCTRFGVRLVRERIRPPVRIYS